jgi:hypothetical protein
MDIAFSILAALGMLCVGFLITVGLGLLAATLWRWMDK